MTRMLLIGPPGSGKGTQAERISTQLGIVAISTGEIFRENVRGQTELGVEARKYMDKGDFVPDRVTNSMVRDRLAKGDAPGGSDHKPPLEWIPISGPYRTPDGTRPTGTGASRQRKGAQ